jgi:hypothetical protein
LSWVEPGWGNDEEEGEAAIGEGYDGGEDNRCGPGEIAVVV